MKRLSRGSKLNKGRRNVYCRAASVSRIFAHSVCHKLLKSVAAMAAMAAMVPMALSCSIPVSNRSDTCDSQWRF